MADCFKNAADLLRNPFTGLPPLLRQKQGAFVPLGAGVAQPAMDLSRDKNAEEMKWSPLEMGAAMQAHGA